MIPQATATRPVAGRPARTRPDTAGPDRSDRRRREATRPSPERLATTVARVFLEVEAGRRPLSQLEPVLSPVLASRLAHLLRRPDTRPGPGLANVLGVRTCWPTPHVCEASVVVRRGERAGVLAIRVERHRGAWRVADIARPEDGLPALRSSAIPEPAPPPPDAFDETEPAALDRAAG